VIRLPATATGAQHGLNRAPNLPKDHRAKRIDQPTGGWKRLAREQDMGMRIAASGPAQASSQSSVAQWQQRQLQVPVQPPVSNAPPAPAKPTANLGNHLNIVA
jgi:hypothetical protein